MFIRVFITLLFCSVFFSSYSQQNKTQLYIDKYKDLAIDEMNNYGIPASITLSQGILESGNGESMLAIEANNHFGIKCHKQWDGEKIYADDDEEGECFRKYPTVFDSYRDHSLFLSERERYAGLFDLSPKDYKRWAKGLKKAGYATNPDYAKKLIKIIKRHNLNQYDVGGGRLDFEAGLIFGFPYGFGIGGYWITDMSIYSINFQSLIYLNQVKFAYNMNFINDFYVGCGVGLGYAGLVPPLFSSNTSAFAIITPQLSYKRNRDEGSDFLFSLGVTPIEVSIKDFGTSTIVVPFIDVIYLISGSKDYTPGSIRFDLIGD